MTDHDHEHPPVPSDHVGVSSPGGIDCATVLADVFLYLDDEADADARERIRVHLDSCTPCLRQFGVEREVKALIARCCGGDVAPDHLLTSIRTSLTQVTVGDTTVTVVDSTTEVTRSQG